MKCAVFLQSLQKPGPIIKSVYISYFMYKCVLEGRKVVVYMYALILCYNIIYICNTHLFLMMSSLCASSRLAPRTRHTHVSSDQVKSQSKGTAIKCFHCSLFLREPFGRVDSTLVRFTIPTAILVSFLRSYLRKQANEYISGKSLKSGKVAQHQEYSFLFNVVLITTNKL